MQNMTGNSIFINKLRILFSVVLLEWLLFIFSGVSFSFLHGNSFFSLEADPVSWIFYIAKIPQFITTHQWFGITLDISVVILLLLFIRNPFNNRLAILLFILLLLFYTTLMGHLAHRNYQSGFCLIFIPFMFIKERNRYFTWESVRYFLLFFYFSAAVLKIYNNALSDPAHFSHLISGQFTAYFLEGNTGLRTTINLYLSNHPSVSQLLFIASFIIELTTIAGFFTKRFDKWIAILLLLFHLSNWFIMDIAPFGQIAFICLLFISKDMKKSVIAGNDE